MIGMLLQNRYRLDAEVGHGGMGAVYRSSTTLFDRPEALMVFATLLKSPRSFSTLQQSTQLHPEV
jgi:hypothetical protein